MSGHLNPGGMQFRDDNGGADPLVAQALAAYVAGEASEQAMLTALSAARLLVPVVAVLADGSASAHSDKNSEMVLPTLIGRDGRPAVLAFTCLDALARWRSNARPVPAEADRVWRAAVADECAVVIDVAGPIPLAVEGARLEALAGGGIVLSLSARDWEPVVDRAASSIAARLAGRLRRGIEFSVAPARM